MHKNNYLSILKIFCRIIVHYEGFSGLYNAERYHAEKKLPLREKEVSKTLTSATLYQIILLLEQHRCNPVQIIPPKPPGMRAFSYNETVIHAPVFQIIREILVIVKQKIIFPAADPY